MYDFTLPAQSTKSGIWIEMEVVNDETDDLFDLSALTEINAAIRYKNSTTVLASASLTDGRVELPSDGVLRIIIPPSALTSIVVPETCDISISGTDGDLVSQIVLGEIPFVIGF